MIKYNIKISSIIFLKNFLKKSSFAFSGNRAVPLRKWTGRHIALCVFYFDFWLISKAFQKACWACEVSTFTIYFVHKSYFLGVLRRSARMGGWPGLSMRTCSPSIWEARKAFRFSRFSLFTFYSFVSSVRSSSGYHGLIEIRSAAAATHFFRFFKFFRF